MDSYRSETDSIRMGSLFLLGLSLAGLLSGQFLSAAEPVIRFEDGTQSAGLKKPLTGLLGHGGAVGDFDADGDLDIFIGGFADRPDQEYAPATSPPPNVLLVNNGDGKFTVAPDSAVQAHARTSGAVFADLNNNGLLELYVANNAKANTRRKTEPQRSAQLQRSQLLALNQDGRYRDVTVKANACPPNLLTARNIGVFDYNHDGLLDLLLVEDRFRKGGSQSRLLKNTGDLSFRDVTATSGLPSDIFGLGLAAADLNGDRVPELFVPHSNRFFVSQTDGKYAEAVSLSRQFQWQPLHNEDWPCGATFGDLNNDGLLDLVVSIHCTTARNRVYLNRGLDSRGQPKFVDVTRECGLHAAVPTRCPHVELQDFDNDGRLDLYLSAGWLNERGECTPLVYRNQKTRADGIPLFVAPQPLTDEMVYYPAGPSGDFDGDGRIDLCLINWFRGNHCRLLLNRSPKRAWLQVTARGRTSNRMGIGSEVRVYARPVEGQPRQLLGYQQIQVGFGYASGQAAVAHFGLGDHQSVDVQVVFPSGRKVERLNCHARQALTITEPE